MLDGTKYDHSLKSVIRPLLVCALALYIAGLFWDIAHHTGLAFARRPLGIFLCVIPAMAMVLKPRWQLGPDALWLLSGKKRVIAPYVSIEGVRVIKAKGDGSKIFEITSSGKTYKLDVLQGEAFEKDLANHIGADRIVAS
jgi:hypothetical protein